MSDFETKFRELLKDDDTCECDKLELSLRELARMSIASQGSVELGLQHLSSHLGDAVNSLVSTMKPPTLH